MYQESNLERTQPHIQVVLGKCAVVKVDGLGFWINKKAPGSPDEV
jgi:hypothetical protein